MNEVVGTLSLDAEPAHDAVGEVPKVTRHDYLGAAADGCGDDMAVVFVGEFDCSDESLIPGDEAVGYGSDHELAGSYEAGWVESRVRSDDAGNHLVKDGVSPLGPEQAGACEPDQQVAQRRRM